MTVIPLDTSIKNYWVLEKINHIVMLVLVDMLVQLFLIAQCPFALILDNAIFSDTVGRHLKHLVKGVFYDAGLEIRLPAEQLEHKFLEIHFQPILFLLSLNSRK